MDIAAYKRAVIDLRPTLLLVAKRITRNSEDAEDVVQEVCLKLWHRCRTDGEPDNVEAYCMTMTKNISIDKIRG
ncbi:MAG: sigma factor, partial [Proteiniphilum sp.]